MTETGAGAWKRLVCIDTMYYDKYVASQNTTEADVSAALSNSLHCQNFWTL